ncbi:hypothetical protein Gogos_018112 [Gossypium gossypioides]|uniref:Uncharacterized protein n=1 Tax=Gossypium gossypioides TaxID=34282 RepID=A0A7J9BEL7_GOSGO|nr:hypothetical protein [Gossypium gossypioides]
MAEVEAFSEFRGKKSDNFEYSKPKFKPKSNVRDCSKKSSLSPIEGDDEPHKETMKLGLILSFVEANKGRKRKG